MKTKLTAKELLRKQALLRKAQRQRWILLEPELTELRELTKKGGEELTTERIELESWGTDGISYDDIPGFKHKMKLLKDKRNSKKQFQQETQDHED
jgi:hypothetical protein